MTNEVATFKGTPGEWQFRRGRESLAPGAEPMPPHIAAVRSLPDGGRETSFVCQLIETRQHEHETEANAHLIAGAKGLLAAAQRLAEWLDRQASREEDQAKTSRFASMQVAYEADAKNHRKMQADLEGPISKALGQEQPS